MGYSLGAPSEFKALRTALTTHERERFTASRAASAAVEFAIVGPVLLLLMSGIFTYGGYFLTAHTVQQLANDAARASIAGLDDTERLALARESRGGQRVDDRLIIGRRDRRKPFRSRRACRRGGSVHRVRRIGAA